MAIVTAGFFAVARRMRVPGRYIALVVVALATTASFIYGNVLSGVDQEVAYFDSLARFWQLGMGALMALIVDLWRPDLGKFSLYVTSLGLLMILSTGFLINGREHFPYWPALYPLVGAALVILGAHHSGSHAIRRVMGSKFFNDMSRYSYALHLWHWPLLIVAISLNPHGVMTWKRAVFVLLLSLALSVLTYYFVEKPSLNLRNTWTPRRLIAAGVSLAVILFGVSTATANTVEKNLRELLAAMSFDSEQHPGANVFIDPELDIEFTEGPIPAL